MASISASPSSASARRNRSMFDRSHGSRATRSSAITRASTPAPTRQIRVGQLCLRAVHCRFEPAVHADLDQPHQRRNVVRHAVDELVQRGGRRAPFVGGNRGPGHDLDAFVPRVRIHFSDRAPKDDQRVAASRDRRRASSPAAPCLPQCDRRAAPFQPAATAVPDRRRRPQV